MDEKQYQYYECTNPDCGLRFPGNAGSLKWNRCPACRSVLSEVAKINYSVEKNTRFTAESNIHVYALLDNIRSAWNVGSIFRTSDGVGIMKIYLCGITPTPENSKVGKTALGAEKSIPWEKSLNGVKTANHLKAQGNMLWVLEDSPDSEPLFQVDIIKADVPIVLIAGNEVTGVDPGILEICNKVISIPMIGNKKSYNVAIAFSIAASFLLYRQRDSQLSVNIFPNT
jgi:23S rRNA (guanosine2251-2'-O)-methyltransferase